MNYTLILVGPSGVEFSRQAAVDDHETLAAWRGLPAPPPPPTHSIGRKPIEYYVWKRGETAKSTITGAGQTAKFFSITYPTLRNKIDRARAETGAPVAELAGYCVAPVVEYDLHVAPSPSAAE